MTAKALTDDLFFHRADFDRTRLGGIVSDALHGADDGELFLEYRQSELISYDDGHVKSASFDTSQGFGLRARPRAMPTPASSAKTRSSGRPRRYARC
jgi:TldD protein